MQDELLDIESEKRRFGFTFYMPFLQLHINDGYDHAAYLSMAVIASFPAVKWSNCQFIGRVGNPGQQNGQ